MTIKLKGRKASLYATAMAISLVALTGTAHAQSASNGKFKLSAKTVQAAGGVKSTTTDTKATLTAAEIDALKISEAAKVDKKVRNDVTAKVLNSLSASSKTAISNVQAAVADLELKDAAKAKAAVALDATGTAVTTKTVAIGTVVNGVALQSTATLAVNGTGVVSGTSYVTNDVTKVGQLVWTGGTTANGAIQVWTASATAAKDIATAEAGKSLTARSAAIAEVTAATNAVASARTTLNAELALATPNAQNVLEKTAALNAAQTRLDLANTAQTAASLNYTKAVAAADAANAAFQTATNTKIAADNAQVTSSSAKNFAEQTLVTNLSADTGYKAAIAEVKASTDALVLTAGQAITQAQVDYYKSYGVDLTAVVGGGVVGGSGAAGQITADQVTAANASLAGVTNAITRGLGTNLASIDAVTALDNGSRTTTELYTSNGADRINSVLTAAAASTNASLSMASKTLTDDAAALDVNAQFEIEVLDTLVNHETRITAIEDVVGDVTANTAAIALETTERKAADAVLTTAIATEVTERKAADAALDTRVTATANGLTKEVADRIAADTANNNARIAEDTRLAGLITAESNARVAMGQELSDRIASSTATAIALGGAALLPDMGFTLSGNVAFYEGAQAIALNAAAKVGPNAYVTAAAGGGLNKRGSVGGRVGFVIGF